MVVFRVIYARAYARIKSNFRSITNFLYDTLLPILQTISLVYIYKSIGADQRFVVFVITGAALFSFWTSTVWGMGVSLYWEKRSGNVELYVTTGGIGPIIVGIWMGDLVTTTIRALAILTIGQILFHVNIGIGYFWVFLPIFLITMVALYGIGLSFSSIFLMWGREAWQLASFFSEPVALFSGLYYPLNAMVSWASAIGAFIPLGLALDSMRAIMYGKVFKPIFPVKIELILLISLAAIYVVVSIILLRKMENISRRDGRLSWRF